MYGPDRPLIVKKLNWPPMLLGMFCWGRIENCWKISPKSWSTSGSCASFGWMMNMPTIPMISCMAPWE